MFLLALIRGVTYSGGFVGKNGLGGTGDSATFANIRIANSLSMGSVNSNSSANNAFSSGLVGNSGWF